MTLSLASIFSDNMVLQQGIPAPVWGTTDAGASIAVTFANESITTVADANGDWKVKLPPLVASAQGRELIVSGANGATLSCNNVLVGEVWLCSGQSNMEWPVVMSNNAETEIAAASFPAIRLFTVPRRLSLHPVVDISAPGWVVCSPETVDSFSAVGYFFGRELHRQLDVPIGLIHSSYGGTPAESWVSREGLLADEKVADILRQSEPDSPAAKQLTQHWRSEMQAIEALVTDKENKGFAHGFAQVTDPPGEWAEMELPSRWQNRGLNFNGIVWFRKTVQLPPRWEGKALQLSIGATDKSDVTYFNGQQVGSVTMQQRSDAWCFLRKYSVPASLVRSGLNVIAVRVHSDRYDGGMIGPAAKMQLSCPDHPHDPPVLLSGTWRYLVEANYGNVVYPPAPPGPENPNTPTILFNGMIAPLVPYAIRGAIWYQGESNADRAAQYRSLFPALIRDWRQVWKKDELAFYFVQLANYTAVKPEPTESDWAELRQAQALALRLPHTGMAVAIDVGEADDIHPRNKQAVGLRLAFSALHQTYGKLDVVLSGPTCREVIEEDQKLYVYFDHTEEGLIVRGKELMGFAVAGADRFFSWCNGKIDGDRVILAPACSEPKYVRYAWADNPVCNLYNSAQLPAVPFEAEIE